MYAVPRLVMTETLAGNSGLEGNAYIVCSLACPNLECGHRIQIFLVGDLQ
jgi:hypothetical protein